MKCVCSKTTKRYRHLVTIEQVSSSATADASGHIDLTDSTNWSTYGKPKVNFISRGGREGKVFDQIEGEVDWIAEMPSTTVTRGINESMRLKFTSRYFNITAVIDVNQARQEVQLYLKEVK